MKKILTSLIILFPYLFILLTYAIITAEKSFMTYVMLTIIMIILFLIIYVITIIDMFRKWKLKTSMIINMLIKITYVPLHLILFIIMGAMANPFLFVLMPVPFIISVMLMGVTGTVSVVAIIKAYRNGNYKLSKAITYSLLSYCYIVDIIIAIMIYIKANKCENKII